jgi:hypothetical protein
MGQEAVRNRFLQLVVWIAEYFPFGSLLVMAALLWCGVSYWGQLADKPNIWRATFPHRHPIEWTKKWVEQLNFPIVSSTSTALHHRHTTSSISVFLLLIIIHSSIKNQKIKIINRSIDHLAMTTNTGMSQRRAVVLTPTSPEPGKTHRSRACCSKQTENHRAMTLKDQRTTKEIIVKDKTLIRKRHVWNQRARKPTGSRGLAGCITPRALSRG